jgi:Protein  of unknown function (DUF3018)
MGKHEVIKPSSTAKSTERVRKHRAEMRAKGYRLKQVWVPDFRNPAFKAEIERANLAMAAHPEVDEEAMAWIDSMNSGGEQETPDFKW